MQATHSVIYSDPSLCFHTELWMKLKPKTVETLFFVGVGVWGRRSKGKGREGNFDEMRLACPALEAVQALSKQPTQQHHPALRVVPSLNVKWAMDVKACQACHYLSLCFYCFLSYFFTLPATRESYQWQIWQTWTSLWCVMMPSNRVQLKGFAQRSYMLALISPLTVSPAYNCLGCTKLPCISGVIT